MCSGSVCCNAPQWQRYRKMFSTAYDIAPPAHPVVQGSGNQPARCGNSRRYTEEVRRGFGHTGKRTRLHTDCRSGSAEKAARGFLAGFLRPEHRCSRRIARSHGAFPAHRINGGQPCIRENRLHPMGDAETAGHRHTAFAQIDTDRSPCYPYRCGRLGRADGQHEGIDR